MSRSYRKAIHKDKGLKNIYWKTIRRVIKQYVNKLISNPELEEKIPNPKEIIDDYDYSDYTIDYEHDKSFGYFWYNNKKATEEHKKWVKKMKRK